MFSVLRSFLGRTSVKSRLKGRLTNRLTGSVPGLETLESRLTPSAVTENQVVNLFQAFLDRVPHSSGLSSWSSALDSGRINVEKMAGMILQSHEYTDRVVKQSFSEYLGRAPGAGGLASYGKALENGVSKERLESWILGSHEYFAKQDSGNIPFVQSLYSKVLGREAEAAGLEGYVAELSRGVTRTQVAHAILGSVEYGKLVTADAYQAILGRDASAPELLSWAKSYSQSANGTKAVWTGVAGSPEGMESLSAPVVQNFIGNSIGIVTDGTPFTGGGFDGDGNAYSYQTLGFSQTLPWNGVTFDLGSPNQLNVLVAGGQTILVPQGGFNVLNLAGAAVNGSQQNQQIGVNFSDGTSQVWTQSFSDWGGPQNYGHESIISTQSYRDTASGGTQQFTNHIYGYSYTIPAGKTLASITLPTNQNVRFLDLQMSYSTPVYLSESYTEWGIANNHSQNDGEGDQGFDSGNHYYYSDQLNSSIAWGGATFNFGPVPNSSSGTNNFVQGRGQTITVPPSQDGWLYLAGAGSNGSQQNQTFFMNFSDGSTANWTQSFSDWCSPSNFAGESIIQQQSNWVIKPGNVRAQTNYVYGYAYQIPAEKTLVSVTLPNNTSNLGILGMAIMGSVDLKTIGIVTDGTPFTGGGFDGNGNAYSYQSLGSSQTLPWNGVTFDLGSPNHPNVFVAGGQTIPVPQGGNMLNLAGAAVNSVNSTQPNQQITLTFTDGSTVVWTQSFSDWTRQYNIRNESIISTQSYRDTASGSTQQFTNYIYGYSYPIPAGKTLASITLPTNSNVRFLDLQMSYTTAVDLSSYYTSWGIANGKTQAKNDQGFDGNGHYYYSVDLLSSIAWGGATFNFGPVPTNNNGGNNFVQGKGQTIDLPQGDYSWLYLAGAGSNGSQQNKTFTMLFTDGSTANWTQSFSDWCSPSNFAGESIIQTQSNWVSQTGNSNPKTNYVYGYAYQIPADKTLVSVTLPNNTSNLGILGMAMVAPTVTTVPVIIPGNFTYTTNEPMVLTAYVAAQSGTVAPTGTVEFYATNSAGVPKFLGTQTLGAPSISFQSPASQAVFTSAVPNPLAPGQYNVFFQYTPSAQSGFEASTSLEAQVTITAG